MERAGYLTFIIHGVRPSVAPSMSVIGDLTRGLGTTIAPTRVALKDVFEARSAHH